MEHFSKSSKSIPELKRINILIYICNSACLVQIKSTISLELVSKLKLYP